MLGALAAGTRIDFVTVRARFAVGFCLRLMGVVTVHVLDRPLTALRLHKPRIICNRHALISATKHRPTAKKIALKLAHLFLHLHRRNEVHALISAGLRGRPSDLLVRAVEVPSLSATPSSGGSGPLSPRRLLHPAFGHELLADPSQRPVTGQAWPTPGGSRLAQACWLAPAGSSPRAHATGPPRQPQQDMEAGEARWGQQEAARGGGPPIAAGAAVSRVSARASPAAGLPCCWACCACRACWGPGLVATTVGLRSDGRKRSERERESVTPIQPHKAGSGAARTSPGRSEEMKQCASTQRRTSL